MLALCTPGLPHAGHGLFPSIDLSHLSKNNLIKAMDLSCDLVRNLLANRVGVTDCQRRSYFQNAHASQGLNAIAASP